MCEDARPGTLKRPFMPTMTRPSTSTFSLIPPPTQYQSHRPSSHGVEPTRVEDRHVIGTSKSRPTPQSSKVGG